MDIRELFEGVYLIDGRLATVNRAPGARVYGEELVASGPLEYRFWNPYRSKLAAAIMKGLKELHMQKDSCVLYLGAATGTTPSHVSDIARDGKVFCVEISERNMRQLLAVCERRDNMFPILADANNTEKYDQSVGECDAIYQDVSARDQAEILLKNSRLLKDGGYAYLAIKSQSIDISKKPEQVFAETLARLSGSFEVVQKIDIEPYDSLHLFCVLRKKRGADGKK